MPALVRRRAALGLRAGFVPVTLYLPLGFLIGPAALGVLSADVLAHLDAAITIALATLGVFVGLALARNRSGHRLVAAAALESSVTIACIAGALAFLLVRWQAPLASSVAVVALSLAVAGAASAAGAAESGVERDSIAAAVADLDDVVPLVVAAALLGAVGGSGASRIAIAVGAPVALGATVAAIGWLLFERADSTGERGVFVLGTLAMLGGAAAYVGVSPMLAGMTAGIVWRLAPGRADAIIADDLRKFHHPLVLLLLICAGAYAASSALAFWLLVPFVVFRMTGKVLGGYAASRLVPGAPADIMGAYLVPPGVMGPAIALNLVQAGAKDGVAVLAAVAIGAVLFELAAAAVLPRRAEA